MVCRRVFISLSVPMLTPSIHSRHVEKYLATEAPHKHLVFVLNKIDLVPSKTAVSLFMLLFLTIYTHSMHCMVPALPVRTPSCDSFCLAPLKGRGLLQHWEINIHLLLSLVW